jgi:GxxExxY protein
MHVAHRCPLQQLLCFFYRRWITFSGFHLENRKIKSCKSCLTAIVMEKEDITRNIIGCAYKVHNTLGFGFLESVYKKAMAIELKKVGLEAEQEKPLSVFYEDKVVGDFYVDLFIDDEIIVELKSVQLVNYLNGLKKEVGLLINFGPSGVEVKRKYRKPKGSRQDVVDEDGIFLGL